MTPVVGLGAMMSTRKIGQVSLVVLGTAMAIATVLLLVIVSLAPEPSEGKRLTHTQKIEQANGIIWSAEHGGLPPCGDCGYGRDEAKGE